MPPTLDALVRSAALDLTVLAAADHLDRPVRWVHTSELLDPTPYLEGGELLLTTGMRLRRGTAERRAYVHRLAEAGVVGLGLGIGLSHARVPAALVEAGAECGLPVFSVPRPTPFIAISKLVSSALAAEQYETVAASFAAQQELTRAVLGREGTAALVRHLATRLDGWAALYDIAGRPVHVAPGGMRRHAATLVADIARLRTLPAPASASLPGRSPGERVMVQSLGADRRVRGFLAVGTARPAGPGERQILGAAVSLLTLALEQSRTLRAAETRMRAALLRLLLTGDRVPAGELARGLAEDLGEVVPEGPVRVVVVDGPEESAAAFAEHAALTAAGDGAHTLSGDLGGEMVVVLPDTARQQRLWQNVDARYVDLVLGVSAPADLHHMPSAYRQARQAHSLGRRAGRPVTVHGRGDAALLPLLEGAEVQAWSADVLAPLTEHDLDGRGDLVASLHAWLTRHGQWDAASNDLGVHRHTLRYRMRRVEELLGRRLDDPDVRAELWLALRVRGDVPHSRPGGEGA